MRQPWWFNSRKDEMKQKKWKHCPVCGAKDSMKKKKTLRQTIRLKGYPLLTVKNLEGFECSFCKEVIVTIHACRRVDRLAAEHKAKVDSKKIVAAELMEVSKARKVLHVSRQRVHQMMLNGKIPYVFVGSTRFPIRSGLMPAIKPLAPRKQ